MHPGSTLTSLTLSEQVCPWHTAHLLMNDERCVVSTFRESVCWHCEDCMFWTFFSGLCPPCFLRRASSSSCTRCTSHVAWPAAAQTAYGLRCGGIRAPSTGAVVRASTPGPRACAQSLSSKGPPPAASSDVGARPCCPRSPPPLGLAALTRRPRTSPCTVRRPRPPPPARRRRRSRREALALARAQSTLTAP